MKATVWKYEFPIEDEFELLIPGSGRVVLVGDDPGQKRCLWIMVDADMDPTPVRFALRGTGQPVPPRVFPVGSFKEGKFVWHLFQFWENGQP